jgi:hypothetical protein
VLILEAITPAWKVERGKIRFPIFPAGIDSIISIVAKVFHIATALRAFAVLLIIYLHGITPPGEEYGRRFS